MAFELKTRHFAWTQQLFWINILIFVVEKILENVEPIELEVNWIVELAFVWLSSDEVGFDNEVDGNAAVIWLLSSDLRVEETPYSIFYEIDMYHIINI